MGERPSNVLEKAAGFCPHGNFVASCKTCKAEASPEPLEQKEDEAAREKEINRYLSESLEGETRIAEPMHKECEVSVVIPVYAEREYIFRPLLSLVEQQGIKKDQFETILVVNNPPDAPVRREAEDDAAYGKRVARYQQAVSENKTVLGFIDYLRGGELPQECTSDEIAQLNQIKDSGLRIFAVDKTTPENAFSPENSHVGSARNRGVAEAVARFRDIGKNGIIAQTDADTRFAPNYIATLLDAFRSDPELTGLGGKHEHEIVDTDDVLLEQVAFLASVESNYETLMWLKEESILPAEEWPMFIGSNMTSRAFETALIGGVPKVPAGEDTLFGIKLAMSGKARKAPELITYPADRLSDRTIGSGMQRDVARQELERRGEITLLSPDLIQFQNQLTKDFLAAIRGGQEIEQLRSFFDHKGTEVLDEKEWNLFKDGFEKDRTQFPESVAFMVNLQKLRIMGVFNRTFDRVPLSEGIDDVITDFSQNTDVRAAYDKTLVQKLDVDRSDVAKRRHLVETLLTSWFSDERTPSKDGGEVYEFIRKYLVSLGFSDQSISLDDHFFKKISVIVAAEDSAEAARRKLESVLSHHLLPIEADPLRMAKIQLSAMHEAVHEAKRERRFPLSDTLTYGYDGDTAHIHFSPAGDMGPKKLMTDVTVGLQELARQLQQNDNLERIDNITAVSWIVAAHPGLLERMGFHVQGSVSDEYKQRYFKDETRDVSISSMTREELLQKYGKEK